MPPAPRPERRRASTADLVERIDERERLQLAHAERDSYMTALKAVTEVIARTGGYLSGTDQQAYREALALIATSKAGEK